MMGTYKVQGDVGVNRQHHAEREVDGKNSSRDNHGGWHQACDIERRYQDSTLFRSKQGHVSCVWVRSHLPARCQRRGRPSSSAHHDQLWMADEVKSGSACTKQATEEKAEARARR